MTIDLAVTMSQSLDWGLHFSFLIYSSEQSYASSCAFYRMQMWGYERLHNLPKTVHSRFSLRKPSSQHCSRPLSLPEMIPLAMTRGLVCFWMPRKVFILSPSCPRKSDLSTECNCFPFLTGVKKGAAEMALIFLFHSLSSVSCFLHSKGPHSSESRLGNRVSGPPRVRDDSINLGVSF